MKPKLAFITTGGTISGVSYGSEVRGIGVLKRNYKPKLTGEQVLDKFSHLQYIADIELCDVGVIDSIEAKPTDWIRINEGIKPYLTREDIDGIVVTHGTDTISWSLMATALVAQNPSKPIVFTGAMVPSDQNYDHVNRNLTDAVYAAAHSGINEVMLCFVGDETNTYTDLYRGSRVIKQRPQKYAGFKSWMQDPIAKIIDREVIQNPEVPLLYGPNGEPVIGENDYSTSVCTIRTFPHSNHGAVDNIRDIIGGILLISPSRGTIGNYRSLADSVKQSIDEGIIVAMCTESEYAKLCASETDRELREYGVIPLGDMNSEKAEVKLSWVAGQVNGDQALAKEMMQRNYAGEITPDSHEPQSELDYLPN